MFINNTTWPYMIYDELLTSYMAINSIHIYVYIYMSYITHSLVICMCI